MQKINLETGLRDVILQLESKQAEEGEMLREQFHLAYESIRPINLIKSTFKEVAASQELKDSIISTGVGLAVGYLSKKLFVSVSRRPFKKILGAALMFGITNVVAKNPEVVKSLGKGIFNIIRNKSCERVNISGNKIS